MASSGINGGKRIGPPSLARPNPLTNKNRGTSFGEEAHRIAAASEEENSINHSSHHSRILLNDHHHHDGGGGAHHSSTPTATGGGGGGGAHASSSSFPEEKTLTIQNVFCGRDAEILQLEKIFRRAASGGGKKPRYPNLVLIGGASGAGKSTLVSRLKSHLAIIEEELFWISGKFEDRSHQQDDEQEQPEQKQQRQGQAFDEMPADTSIRVPAPMDDDEVVNANTSNNKSKLRSLKKSLNRSLNSSLGEGNWNFGAGDEDDKASQDTLHPFTAIVDAFQSFCQELEEEEPDTIEEVREDILEAVGQQGGILTSMIPSLTGIIGEQPGGDASARRESRASELKRFHLVFRNFLQALASQLRSVVLVLDDFHAADAASLELLYSLMTSELKHVLLIGTYQSNQTEGKPNHRFNRWIKRVREGQSPSQPPPQQQQQQPKQHPEQALRMSTSSRRHHHHHQEQSTTSISTSIRRTNTSGSTAAKSTTTTSTITMIELSAMDLETINEVVSDVLELPPDSTRSLAHIIYTKTKGNAFYATQYLLFLNKKNLVWFDPLQQCWTWDEEAIRKEAAVTSSLIDFMREKMLHSEVAHKILPVAACLGAKFSQKTLELILKDISKIETLQQVLVGQEEDVQNLLKLCHKEGFIESCGNKHYGFAHDKMIEAAMTLHPTKTMQQIRFEAGGTLFRKLNPEEVKEKLFVIVNLLNTSPRCSVSPFEIAQLNLEAAKKAKNLAAFGSAATYIEHALYFFPSSSRHNKEFNSNNASHRSFLLEACSLGAEVESATGRMDKMKDYVDRVCRSSFQYDIFEQLRVQNVLIECSANIGGQLEMALRYCFIVLEELGCTFPRTVIGQGIRSVTSLLRSKAPRNIPKLDDVDNMSLMTDPARVEMMRLLDRAATYAYLMENQLVFTMCTTRMIRWTIRYGLCDKSPATFALMGLVLMHIMGDYKAGVWHAQLALLMVKKLESLQGQTDSPEEILTKSHSRTSFITNGMVLYWTKPLSDYKDEMVTGYDVGMQVGDIESAFWNAYFHLAIKYASGAPLKQLEKLCRSGVSEMVALHREEVEGFTRVFWQGVLNLIGYSPAEGTTELLGSAIPETGWVENHGAASKLLPYMAGWMRNTLCTYLGEYEEGARLAVERGDSWFLAAPGVVWQITDPFMRGVSLYAAASQTNSRYYRQHGQKCRATLRSWVKKGIPTAIHQLKLLDAEHEACMGRPEKARSMYQEACSYASSEGFIQHAALANERFAYFLLGSSSADDEAEGRVRLVRALSLYDEWGAKAKVERLIADHPDFCTPVKDSPASKASSKSSTFSMHGASSYDMSPSSGHVHHHNYNKQPFQ